MPSYVTLADAAAAGYRIVHEPDRSRYAIYRDGEPEDVGEAHYTLLGEDAINFDHTFVRPADRGTGLSELLAHAAVTGEASEGRQLRATCWFIQGYLRRHPDLLAR